MGFGSAQFLCTAKQGNLTKKSEGHFIFIIFHQIDAHIRVEFIYVEM